jgi:hypothetical protein
VWGGGKEREEGRTKESKQPREKEQKIERTKERHKKNIHIKNTHQ